MHGKKWKFIDHQKSARELYSSKVWDQTMCPDSENPNVEGRQESQNITLLVGLSPDQNIASGPITLIGEIETPDTENLPIQGSIQNSDLNLVSRSHLLFHLIGDSPSSS